MEIKKSNCYVCKNNDGEFKSIKIKIKLEEGSYFPFLCLNCKNKEDNTVILDKEERKKVFKKRYKKIIKKQAKKIKSLSNLEELKNLIPKAQRNLDLAKKKGMIHKNRARKKVSYLYKILNKSRTKG